MLSMLHCCTSDLKRRSMNRTKSQKLLSARMETASRPGLRTRSQYGFFFSSRRRHTRCLSDWSSDVCSSDLKELIAVSREAVQTAEDAREIAVKKLIAQHQSNELQASARVADDATRQKEVAEARAAKAKSDMERSQANSANQVAAAQAETDQARLAASQANAQVQVAENDKAAMRAKLSLQLNTILQTRDTARGLIVNMSDVLFDTGKYTLLPGAREKLSRVAGILIAYPGLDIAVFHQNRRSRLGLAALGRPTGI